MGSFESFRFKIDSLRSGKTLSDPKIFAFAGTLITFLVLISIWWYAGLLYEESLVADQRIESSSELISYSTSLTTSLNVRFSLLEGLGAFVLVNPSETALDKSFNSYSSSLYSSVDGIRNFAVAPAGVQQYVYPLENNEAVPGHDLINDPRPDVRADVQRTIQTRQTVLSGPYELRQGGFGLVERKAVYIDETFWGLVTMVVDMDPVFEEAGLSSQNRLDIAIRDNDGNVFYGDHNVFDKDPVLMEIGLAGDKWELAGVPAGGWQSSIRDDLIFFRITGLAIILLISFVVYLNINRQALLSLAVKEYTKDLSRAYSDLRSLDRMKDEFVSNVGHELKTPLISIKGYSELVFDEVLGPLNEKQKSSMDAIVRNSERLDNLINSLLYLSIEKEGNIEYSFGDVHVSNVLDRVLFFRSRMAEDRFLDIHVDVANNLPVIAGDEDRVADAFGNILDNAIKFTPEHGSIIISALEDGDHISVSITDSGIGIPEDHLDDIFNKFYQIDASAKRKFGGAGLGLYIAKKIINAHNGDIRVESRSGLGTTVYVRLPI